MDDLSRSILDSAGAFHATWGWVVVGILGLVGFSGVGIHLAKRIPGPWFKAGLGVAIGAMLLQIGLGLWAFGVDDVQPGNQHVFYGIVTGFTLAFAYIYRIQLAKRPGLYYGLLALFMMGLGIRGIMTFGNNFGS